MAWLGLIHHHPSHRARQLRWVVPIVVLIAVATLATLVVQYKISDQMVGTEFFRAHKTISHTGELLQRGMLIGGAVLTAVVVALAWWALRLTHRIVRPVHTLHRTLDAMVGGDLGVRVELHRHDEFQEVGDALNRLADEFATTLARVHALVDRIAGLTGHAADASSTAAAVEMHAVVRELDDAMEFFRLAPRHTIAETDH
jgi:methyl-accepting chemotaxis protein